MKEPTDEELMQYIKQYQMVDDFDHYLYDTKDVYWKIYLPFFIKTKETTVDMEIVKKLKLKYYSEPGIEQWSTDKELQSASFRFLETMSIARESLTENPESMNDYMKRGEEEFIDGCIKNIKKITDSKKVFEINVGFCDEEDCQGHTCGEIIYHVIGWAGDYVKGDSLRKTIVPKASEDSSYREDLMRK